MRLYVSNAFSLSMLGRDEQSGTPAGYTPRAEDTMTVARVPRPVDNPRELLAAWADHGVQPTSIVGHADTAAVLSAALDIELTPNRVSVKLAPGDVLLVGQYIGPRLPEGTTALVDRRLDEARRIVPRIVRAGGGLEVVERNGRIELDVHGFTRDGCPVPYEVLAGLKKAVVAVVVIDSWWRRARDA